MKHDRPKRKDNDVMKHPHQAIDEISDFDTILSAAAHVPVPPDLADRLLTHPAYLNNKQVISSWPLGFALAASILLGVGIGLWLQWPADVETQILAHIYEELAHLSEDHHVTTVQVREAFKTMNVNLEGNFGPVHFVAPCTIDNQTAIHLVMSGQVGAVTLIYLPKKQTDTLRTIGDKRFKGQLIATPGGVLALVGEQGEDIATLGQQVLAQLRWPSKT